MNDPAPAKPSLPRRLAVAATVWIFVLLFFYAAGEIAVRVVYAGGRDFTLEMWKYARKLKQVSPDPLLAHVHRPGSRARLMGVDVSINSRGLRDREFPYEKPAGTLRVLMLGDSETFGWGVPQDGTTPKVAEKRLNEEPPGGMRIEVLNAGVGNYNTQMEVRYFLTEGYQYRPDLVTLNYVFNDAEETPRYQGNWWNEHSQLWVWLGGRLDVILRKVGERRDWSAYYSGLYREDAAGWRNARTWLARLADHCRRQNIPLFFVNHPELRILDPYPFLWLNERLRGIAGDLGMEFIELYDAVKGEPPASLWVTVPDPHPNKRACAIFGRAIAERIRPLLATLASAAPAAARAAAR
jgi:lysophospholipase L1-like esterase